MANGISYFIGGIFWLYLASLLQSEGYGELSYFLAAANLAAVFSNFGSNNTITVFTSKTEKIQASLYLIPIIISTTSSIILFFILENPFVGLYVIGSVIYSFWVSSLLGLKHYKKFSITVIIEKVSEVILALSLYMIMGIDGVILGLSLSTLMFVVPLMTNRKSWEIKKGIIKSTLNFSLHSYALNLSRRISLSADKIIIMPLLGFSIIGNYQLAVQALLLLNIIPMTVYQYILPTDAIGKNTVKIKKLTISSSVVLTVLGVIFVPDLLRSFFPEFIASTEIIPVLIPAIIPMSITLMFTAKLLANEKSNQILLSSMIFAGSHIIGIFVLTEYLGIVGTAIALLLASVIQSIFLFVMNWRIFKTFF